MFLAAFRPQLAGLVALLFLAATTAIPPVRFVFLSSATAVEGNLTSPPAEMVLGSLDTPPSFGHGRVKFLAELLVDAGARHLGNRVCATITRVGQVASPVQRSGLWNPKKWFPNMLPSSLYLGQMLSSLGPRFDSIDFVPIDVLADVLVELFTTTAVDQESGTVAVLNLRNPQLTPWSVLLPAITDTTTGQLDTLGSTPMTMAIGHALAASPRRYAWCRL